MSTLTETTASPSIAFMYSSSGWVGETLYIATGGFRAPPLPDPEFWEWLLPAKAAAKIGTIANLYTFIDCY